MQGGFHLIRIEPEQCSRLPAALGEEQSTVTRTPYWGRWFCPESEARRDFPGSLGEALEVERQRRVTKITSPNGAARLARLGGRDVAKRVASGMQDGDEDAVS